MQVNEREGVQIIGLPARVDVTTSPLLEELCHGLLESGQFKIVCDFSANEYVSSAGLRVFLSTLKRARKAGGDVVLCCLKPGVLEIFDMTGFTSLFKIADSLPAALSLFQPPAPVEVSTGPTIGAEKKQEEIEAIRIAKQAKEATLAYETAQKLGQKNEQK
jgi:anti-anti-sigma factor